VNKEVLFKKMRKIFKQISRYVVSLCRVYIGSMIMININTNYGSLFASNSASKSQRTMDTAMERLSSGLRINSAKDDAAGQGIATRLTAEIQGLAVASRNASDAQSMLDTAEGALQETHTVLLRMRELAVQGANGALTSADLNALDAEFQQLEAEIDRIAANTKWGGKELLTSLAVTFQVGTANTSDDRISFTMPDTDSSTLGITAAVAVTSTAGAQGAITVLDSAISKVSEERGRLGAQSNRLGSTVSNLENIKTNLMQAKGRIMDADFAVETGNLAKSQILQQAATAMLAQANASKQTVLTLIR
jgi:flagellin